MMLKIPDHMLCLHFQTWNDSAYLSNLISRLDRTMALAWVVANLVFNSATSVSILRCFFFCLTSSGCIKASTCSRHSSSKRGINAGSSCLWTKQLTLVCANSFHALALLGTLAEGVPPGSASCHLCGYNLFHQSLCGKHYYCYFNKNENIWLKYFYEFWILFLNSLSYYSCKNIIKSCPINWTTDTLPADANHFDEGDRELWRAYTPIPLWQGMPAMNCSYHHHLKFPVSSFKVSAEPSPCNEHFI